MLARGRLSFPLWWTDGVKATLPVGLQPWGRKQHAEPGSVAVPQAGRCFQVLTKAVGMRE